MAFGTYYKMRGKKAARRSIRRRAKKLIRKGKKLLRIGYRM